MKDLPTVPESSANVLLTGPPQNQTAKPPMRPIAHDDGNCEADASPGHFPSLAALFCARSRSKRCLIRFCKRPACFPERAFAMIRRRRLPPGLRQD